MIFGRTELIISVSRTKKHEEIDFEVRFLAVPQKVVKNSETHILKNIQFFKSTKNSTFEKLKLWEFQHSVQAGVSYIFTNLNLRMRIRTRIRMRMRMCMRIRIRMRIRI